MNQIPKCTLTQILESQMCPNCIYYTIQFTSVTKFNHIKLYYKVHIVCCIFHSSSSHNSSSASSHWSTSRILIRTHIIDFPGAPSASQTPNQPTFVHWITLKLIIFNAQLTILGDARLTHIYILNKNEILCNDLALYLVCNEIVHTEWGRWVPPLIR